MKNARAFNAKAIYNSRTSWHINYLYIDFHPFTYTIGYYKLKHTRTILFSKKSYILY